MKFKKMISVILLVAFAFCMPGGVVFADDYDFAYKRLGELENIDGSSTASADQMLLYDASTGKGKTMLLSGDAPKWGGDSTFQSNLLAVGRKNGVSTMSSSSTAINPLNGAFVVYIKQAGGANGLDSTDGGTRLSAGTPGQVIVLYLLGVMTGGSWIITPDTSTTFTSVTLATANEHVALLYVNDTIGWMIWGNEGGVVDTTAIFDGLGFLADNAN